MRHHLLGFTEIGQGRSCRNRLRIRLLPNAPIRTEAACRRSASASVARCQSRVGDSVLADRTRHLAAAAKRRLGSEGDRSAGGRPQKAFPEMHGFSPRSLKYMCALAEAWPDEQSVQQLSAQIPWRHNVRLLESVKDRYEREWYVRATLQHG